MNSKKKIRLILFLSLTAMVCWLLYMGIVPGGEITYTFAPGESNFFISKLAPLERIFEESKIIGDPAYFSLRTSRGFDSAEVSLEYIKRGDLPIIEVGVLADKNWRYNLRPAENEIIDGLKDWHAISEDGLIFLQRNKKFKNVKDFLMNMPDPDEIALYNYDLEFDYSIPEYEPEENEKILSLPLRGPYQLLTYIKKEDLNFEFLISDLNKNKDSDNIDVLVYFNNSPIYSSRLEDDGIAADNGEIGADRKIKIDLPNLPEGVYKIEFKAGDDIVTKQIATSNKKFVFANKIWLADGGRENISIFSNSKFMAAKTTNPGSLQKIKIGESELDLNKTFDQVGAKTDYSLKDIRLEKDDVILAGDGLFAFGRDNFFNPLLKRISNSTEIDSDGINYVLAKYSPPAAGGEFKIASINFDLTSAYRENGKYGFLISVPGLLPENGAEDGVEIEKISIKLKGKNIFEFLRDKLGGL